MPLSLQEKLALIYTSAGSQRNIAALVGISHQKVGRILKAGQPELGGYPKNSRALEDPGLIAAVDAAFSIHKDVTKAQARRDKIPYDDRMPVFSRRVPHSDGTPGGRVAGEHTHWLSDDMRNRWITRAFKTRKYAAVSVQSTVSLYDYMQQATRRAKDSTTKEALMHKILLDMELRSGRKLKTVGTPYTPLQFPDYALPVILQDVDDKLRQRHAPAVGAPGTLYANRIMLQLDTRTKKQSATKPRKAGTNRGGTKRRK